MLALMSVLFGIAFFFTIVLCVLVFKAAETNNELKAENKELKELLSKYLPDKVENLEREKTKKAK